MRYQSPGHHAKMVVLCHDDNGNWFAMKSMTADGARMLREHIATLVPDAYAKLVQS
jgi:hypothetical protein